MPTGTISDEATESVGPITQTGPKTYIVEGQFHANARIRVFVAPVGETIWKPVDRADLPIRQPGPVTLDLYNLDVLFVGENLNGDVNIHYTA